MIIEIYKKSKIVCTLMSFSIVLIAAVSFICFSISSSELVLDPAFDNEKAREGRSIRNLFFWFTLVSADGSLNINSAFFLPCYFPFGLGLLAWELYSFSRIAGFLIYFLLL